jgi:hypothetical protein
MEMGKDKTCVRDEKAVEHPVEIILGPHMQDRARNR